jgi:hypothetical protein
MVRGEYIGSVDNDDAVDLDFYEKLHAKATETGADIVKGNCRIFDYSGKENIQYINGKVRENKMFFSSQWWSAIYDKNLFFDNNIRFPEDLILGGDLVFLNRAVLRSSKIDIYDDTYYNYFRREYSGSSKILNIKKIKSLLIACDTILNEFNRVKNDQYCDPDNDIVFQKILFCCISMLSRSAGIESRQIIAEAIINFYYKCKIWKSLDAKLSAAHPRWYKFLPSNDAAGLANYLLKYNNLSKFIAADLRARIRSECGCVTPCK